MSNHENYPETVRVTLSPVEGEQLFVFLSELAEAGAGQIGLCSLDELLGKLGDANELALWLRENLNLELEGREATIMLETLETLENNAPAEGSSPETDQILLGVRIKVQECLGGASCVGKSN